LVEERDHRSPDRERGPHHNHEIAELTVSFERFQQTVLQNLSKEYNTRLLRKMFRERERERERERQRETERDRERRSTHKDSSTGAQRHCPTLYLVTKTIKSRFPSTLQTFKRLYRSMALDVSRDPRSLFQSIKVLCVIS
jgi:hypothetical protein